MKKEETKTETEPKVSARMWMYIALILS